MVFKKITFKKGFYYRSTFCFCMKASLLRLNIIFSITGKRMCSGVLVIANQCLGIGIPHTIKIPEQMVNHLQPPLPDAIKDMSCMVLIHRLYFACLLSCISQTLSMHSLLQQYGI